MEKAHGEKEAETPREYVCPITRELMNCPVFTADGHTYERRVSKKKENNSQDVHVLSLVLHFFWVSHARTALLRCCFVTVAPAVILPESRPRHPSPCADIAKNICCSR